MMWMHSRIERAETAREMGLYMGPAFLALMLGRAIYEVACDGWKFALVRSREDLQMGMLFVVIGLLVAFVARSALTRVGWLLFAALHAIIVLGPQTDYLPNRWMLNGLFVAFAVVITVGGARDAPRRAMMLAGCGFVVLLAFSYATRYYADVVLQRHSVVRSSALC